MKYCSRQRPSAGRRFCGNVVHPRREIGRFRCASLFTLLRLIVIVIVSVHDVAQASAAELSLLDLAPEVEVESNSGVATEPTQWRAVPHEAPPCEFPALEPETNADPVESDAPSIIRLVFGCAATVTPTGQMFRAASVNYSTKFAASAVLARAPPCFARAPKRAPRHGAR